MTERLVDTSMTGTITVQIDGRIVPVPAGCSAVAALVIADSWCTRRSVTGEPRFALCGMGQCQECRVTVDGQPHRLACQVRCRDGMVIDTGAGTGTGIGAEVSTGIVASTDAGTAGQGT